jgi:hypothetical protein
VIGLIRIAAKAGSRQAKIDDTENGRVRPDTETEDQERGDGETGGF